MNRVIGFSINKTDEDVFEAVRTAFNDFDNINEIEEIRTRKDPFEEGRSELLNNSLRGIIRNKVNNANGYAICYEQKSKMAKNNREVNFLQDNDYGKGYKGISESYYVSPNQQGKNEIDGVNDRLDHDSVIADFEEFYDTVAVEHGINLRSIIGLALRTGHRSYVSRIRLLIEEYGKHELIETILRNEELCYKLGLKGEANDSTVVWNVDKGNDKECETAPKMHLTNVSLKIEVKI